MWQSEVLIILAMIAVNSVLAAYEIALASVTLARLGVLAEEKKPGAVAALFMKKNIEGSLAGIQLGITLVGAIAAATGGASAGNQIAPLLQTWLGFSPNFAEFVAITLVVIPLTAFTILFGELVPKVFALRNKERVCLLMSPALWWFVTLVRPVVWVLETLVVALTSWSEKRLQIRNENSELQELRASVALARTARLIGVQEEQIILRAANLTTRPVQEIMLPAQAMNMLDAHATLAEALAAAHHDMHTRYPVTEQPGDPSQIVGYVNFKDMVAHLASASEGTSLREIVREILSFSTEMPVSTCLQRLIQERAHIALVRDTDNRVLGMVTMEDMLEELVGDIEDEYDRLPTHLHASGRGWLVGGGIRLEQLRQVTGLPFPYPGQSEEAQSLNDWICQERLHPLKGGEVVELPGGRVVVRKIRRHRVLEARIDRTVPGSLRP
jgi:putative hemolysin